MSGTQNVCIVVDAGLCRDGKPRPGSFNGFEISQMAAPNDDVIVSERDQDLSQRLTKILHRPMQTRSTLHENLKIASSLATSICYP